MIYLDNAATSRQKPRCVISRFIRETVFSSSNAGRGSHSGSLKAVMKIIDTQEKLARLFHIPDPERICFTQNATYGLNMAIGGLLAHGGHSVATYMDHNSVLRPIHQHGPFTTVLADEQGYVHADYAKNALQDHTKLMACTHISNVCGSVEPVKALCSLAHEHGIPFILDASQSAGCHEINLEDIGADIMVCSGHKGLLGPLGTGILYIKRGIYVPPYITGGTGSMSESLEQPDILPDMYHSGTLNTPAIAALGTAADFIMREGVDTIAQRETALAKAAVEDLLNIHGIKVYGSTNGEKRNGTVAFNIMNLDCSQAAEILNRDYHIAVRSGFHCAPLAHRALGTSKTGCIRASFGFFSTEHERKKFISAVHKIAKTRQY